MIPLRKRPLTEASPHSVFGVLTAALFRTLLVGLLAVGLTTGSRAQARPPIEWMRGAIDGTIIHIAISPDGTDIAMSGTDGTVKIRRLSDGMLLETLVDTNVTLFNFGASPPTVNSFAYTPDGSKIITGNSASVIHVWDLASQAVVKTLSAPASVNAIAISPNSNTLAAGMTTNDVLLWNLSDYSSAGTLGGHTAAVTALAFSPDSTQIATGSSDKTVRVWNIATASSLITLPQGNAVTSVVFSDGVTVCAGDSGAFIKIWNTSSTTPLHSITGATSFSSQNVSLAVSPDGTHLAAGYLVADTKVHLFRISDATSLATADTTFPVIGVAFSPNGSQVYTSDANNHIDAWSGVNLAAAGTLAIPFTGNLKTVLTNPAGTQVATGSTDGVVRFWDPATGTLLTSIAPVSGTTAASQIAALAYSKDGTMLAIAGLVPASFGNSTGILWIYRTADNTLVHSLTVTASSVAFTPDGTMLAAGVGNNINLYLTSNLAQQPTLTGHTGAVNAIAISPDGTTLASASSDRTVKTWDLHAGTLLKTLTKHSNSVNCVAFSADSLTVVDGSSDSTSILWNIATATVLQTFTHTDVINSAVFSHDGKQVATGGNDRHLKIWDTAGGMILRDYTLETGAPVNTSLTNGVTSIVYSQDGKSLYYGRNDWTLVCSDNPLFVPLITGLTINPNTVVGGSTATGTVTLNSTTLSQGAVVSLSSDTPGVANPATATVTVPPNSATATFTINTSGVTVQSIANITASLNGSSATAPITVVTPTVMSLSLSPTSVRGGQPSNGTVTLTGPAPAGGLTVTLSSNNTNAIAPANVKVAAGTTTGTFAIPTNVVGTTNTAIITATLGTSATATLTITPPIVTALSCSPANLKGGQPSTGTVTISDPAPSGGILVTLSSNNAAVASAQGSVTIPAGATTATFPITTHTVPAITQVTFTAAFNGSSQTTVLTVTPPTLNTVTLNPTSVKGGLTSTGTVTISDPAPTGGIPVGLSSANSAVASVPASITIAAGSTTGTFTVTTTPVSTDTPVVLTATIGTGATATTATGTITVLAPALSGFALNPTNIRAYATSNGIVTLDSVAPTGGMTVTLSSPNPAQASMPGTVIVPAGATTFTFPITTGAVPATTTLTLSATLGTVTKTANLVITPNLPFDFDGDGHNDLVFQNSQTGLIYAWFMNGLKVLGASTVTTVPQAGWQVRGAADFNHDGHPDLVIQNQTTGQVVFWYLNGTILLGGEATSVAPGADYKVVGTGDFNGDGNIDLVFQNQKTQAIVFWFMKGAQVIGGATLPLLPASGYNVVGVGDFNADGHPDLLFQNASTGQVVVWYMNGTNFAGGGAISYFPPLVWQVKGVADYNNDGIPDIVFQNSSTHQVLIWFMNGLTVTGGDLISVQPPATYNLAGPH